MDTSTPKPLDADVLKRVFTHNLNRIYFGKCYLDKHLENLISIASFPALQLAINTAGGAGTSPITGSTHAPSHLASTTRTRSAQGAMSNGEPRLACPPGGQNEKGNEETKRQILNDWSGAKVYSMKVDLCDRNDIYRVAEQVGIKSLSIYIIYFFIRLEIKLEM